MNAYSMLKFWTFFALIFCAVCAAIGAAFILVDRHEPALGIALIFVGLVALIAGNIAAQASAILKAQATRIENLERRLR
jgi:hypothetical protein